MIHKVKPPAALRLVPSSKQAKNDLGGQSGESYSHGHPKKDASKDTPASLPPLESVLESPPHASAPINEQVGLTTVVKEWLEASKSSGSITRAKLSLKYQGESAPAKGMLLNKKIS